MPKIIIKRPYSEPKIIEIVSKNLPDLYTELSLRAVHESIGIGLLLITQSWTQHDEPNLIYDNRGILGTVYVIRATKERIVDVKDVDMDYFIECTTFAKSFEE